jgi:hypothetical protein
MDSTDTESDAPPKAPRRPTPVKALEALAKARQVKQEKKLAEMEAKKTEKEKKHKAVEVVAAAKPTNEMIVPTPVPLTVPSPVDIGYLRSIEEKLEKLTTKVSKPKKKIIVEDSSSSEEEVIIKKKKKTTKPPPVEDPEFTAYKESKIKTVERERMLDEKRLEKENLRKLFSR